MKSFIAFPFFASPWIRRCTRVSCLLAAGLATAGAATFYEIQSVESNTVNFFDVNNLIEGPGVGFDDFEPHARLSTSTWVTDAPGGYPSDYVAVAGAPVLVFDLGADVPLGEISVWGYSSGNANGASEFSLRFATDADGPDGFGTTITYNPLIGGPPDGDPIPNDDVSRLSYPFDQTVTARYVEMTITDNWFNDATGGTADPPGGDRVGLGEVAFEVTTAGNPPNIVVPGTLRASLTGQPQVIEVPVLNSGLEDLVVSAVSIGGPNGGAFSNTTVLPLFVESLQPEVIALAFDPTGLEGDVSATVTITSNDPDRPTVDVFIEGSFPAFYPIDSVTTSTFNDFYPVDQLIQGPGIGFVDTPPFDAVPPAGTTLWVTEACGFPCDYLAGFEPPILVFDLGSDVLLAELSVWGYSAGNANGVREFSVRFATEADGEFGFGNTIDYNPTFGEVALDPIPRQSFVFDQAVTARFVEITCIDNWFNEETGGTADPPGGDRVGLGEVAFEIPNAADDPTIEAPLAVPLALDGTMQTFGIPVRNVGVPDLAINGVAFSGPAAAAFSTGMVPATVETFEIATIEITFDPTGLAGPVSAVMEVSTNDPNTPVASIQLSGILHDPQLALPTGPTAIFGPFDVNTGPHALAVTLRNDGATRPLTVSGATLSGADADAFMVAGTPAPIAPGATGTIDLVFMPGAAEGGFGADLAITTDDPVNPVTTVRLIARVRPTDPLVAWWPLDDDASDASGNGHDGIVFETVDFGTADGATGATGTAADFFGGHIDVPWDPDLNTPDFTVTLWANANSSIGDYNSPITNRDDVDPGGAYRHGWILYADPNGSWSFWNGGGLGGSGGWNGLTLTDFIVDQEWIHVALTYDSLSNTKTLYVDGEPVATQNPVAFSPNNSQSPFADPSFIYEDEDLHIGGGGDAGTDFLWDGLIDDVALFSVPLTTDEIQRIRDEGVAGFVGGPARPFAITAVRRLPDGSVEFDFNSKPGKIYVVFRLTGDAEFPEEIDDSVVSQGASTTFTDSNLPDDTRRAYYYVLDPNP